MLESRLNLDPPELPRLTLGKPNFPLSFARWPGSSAGDYWQASEWAGSAAGMHLPFSPLYSEGQVRSSRRAMPWSDRH